MVISKFLTPIIFQHRKLMDFENTKIEEQLKELVPGGLSEALLDRLDAAMFAAAIGIEAPAPVEEKIIVTSSDPELSAIEERLRDLEPYGVPENMISRLDEAMCRWHEDVPVEEKVVSIHPKSEQQSRSWIGLRSAAAVALLGAGMAFYVGGPEPTLDTVTHKQRIPILSDGNTSLAVFTPDNARASVISANDHGVIWTKAGKPVHCTEIHLTNRLRFVNEKGESLILEQPKREVRFTPVKFD